MLQGPSELLSYRIGLFMQTGGALTDELLDRLMAVRDFADLGDADKETLLEAEMRANAGHASVHPGGTRSYELEDRILDEQGLLGLEGHPLPTPAGVPSIAGVPFVTEDGVMHSNPVDGEPDAELITDDAGDAADPDDYPADGDTDGWVGV